MDVVPDDAINVAKEWKHRTSIQGETILAVQHTYTYSDGPTEDWEAGTDVRFNRVRTDDDGSDTEEQQITPPWVEGEIIWAIPADTGAVTETSETIDLLITGRSTQWAGPI
jgi:hypothetical protein